MTIIRPAATDDLPALIAITNWAIDHTHAHFATEHWTPDDARAEFDAGADRYPWLVALQDASIIGYARAAPWKPRGAYARTAEIGVYVHPDHQRKGVARALYDQLIEDLRSAGFRTLVAGIALPNEPSVRLHEAIGMNHVGTFKRIGVKHGVERDVGYWQMFL